MSRQRRTVVLDRVSTEPTSDHEEALKHVGEVTQSRRQKLLAQLEHVQKSERGIPFFWFAPKGSKERGQVDHWVYVAPGEPLLCSCGETLCPFPQPEGPTLETIVGHFATLGAAA